MGSADRSMVAGVTWAYTLAEVEIVACPGDRETTISSSPSSST